MRKRIARALLLGILALLAIVVAEFVALWRVQSIIDNVAGTAARYAVTGQYDEQFDLEIGEWLAANHPDDTYFFYKDGIPCPFVPLSGSSPRSRTIFRDHWGHHECKPGSDEDYWLRRDILRLPSIVLQAQSVAKGLPLARRGPLDDPYLDIPGTALGAQTYEALLDRAQTLPDWLHIYICSTRRGLVTPGLRYDNQNDFQIAPSRLVFARCTVQDSTTYGPAVGTDQYDAGGPGDIVTIIVYYNYRPLTPIGRLLLAKGQPFVRLQAQRQAKNESYQIAKVIVLTDEGEFLATMPPPTPTSISQTTPTPP